MKRSFLLPFVLSTLMPTLSSAAMTKDSIATVGVEFASSVAQIILEGKLHDLERKAHGFILKKEQGIPLSELELKELKTLAQDIENMREKVFMASVTHAGAHVGTQITEKNSTPLKKFVFMLQAITQLPEKTDTIKKRTIPRILLALVRLASNIAIQKNNAKLPAIALLINQLSLLGDHILKHGGNNNRYIDYVAATALSVLALAATAPDGPAPKKGKVTSFSNFNTNMFGCNKQIPDIPKNGVYALLAKDPQHTQDPQPRFPGPGHRLGKT